MTARLGTAVVLALVLAIATPPTAVAQAPPPVVNLRAQSPVWDFSPRIVLYWTLPEGADDALVCWNVGATPPSSPGPMTTCRWGDPMEDPGDFALDGEFREQYAFSVFSHVKATDAFGPPVSVVAVADQDAPDVDAFEDVSDSPVSSSSVRICWGGDHVDAVDTWAVYRTRGSRPGAVTGAPEARWRRRPHCYTAKRLERGRTYTFTIVGSNPAGRVEATRTVKARRPGAYVITSSRRASILPGSHVGSEAILAVSHGGKLTHAVYLKRLGASRRLGVYYSSRTGSGRWSPPVLVTRDQLFEQPLVSANDAGQVVVGWTRLSDTAAIYRYRSSAGRWSAVRRPKAIRFLRALAIDRAGRLHLLATIERFVPNYRQLTQYLTNSSGRWTGTSASGDVMAYDATTDRVVIVEPRNGGGFAVADKPAEGPRFGRRYVARGMLARLRPAALTAVGGQITIVSTVDDVAADRHGVFVASGPGPGRIGPPAHVPGTARNDTVDLAAVATGRDRVLVGWRRSTLSWNGRAGVWLAARERDVRTGRWRFTSIRQATALPYDSLGGITVNRTGQPVIGIGRN